MGRIPVRWKNSVSAFWPDRVIFKGLKDFIREIKVACPQLEMLIDPKMRMWSYLAETDGFGRAFSPRLMGRIEMEQKGFSEDLPWIKPSHWRTLKNMLVVLMIHLFNT